MLTGVTHEMRIMREEIFGPVLPIVVVDSQEEAVALANDSDFGLGASVWTADRAKGERIAHELEAGHGLDQRPHVQPRGLSVRVGWCQGLGPGRTHSKFGLYECVNVKLRVWEPSTMRDPWWHPYDETLGKAFRQSAKLLYGPAASRGRALRDGAVPLTRVGARLARGAISASASGLWRSTSHVSGAAPRSHAVPYS